MASLADALDKHGHLMGWSTGWLDGQNAGPMGRRDQARMENWMRGGQPGPVAGEGGDSWYRELSQNMKAFTPDEVLYSDPQQISEYMYPNPGEMDPQLRMDYSRIPIEGDGYRTQAFDALTDPDGRVGSQIRQALMRRAIARGREAGRIPQTYAPQPVNSGSRF